MIALRRDITSSFVVRNLPPPPPLSLSLCVCVVGCDLTYILLIKDNGGFCFCEEGDNAGSVSQRVARSEQRCHMDQVRALVFGRQTQNF